ncbi:MAG: hypothetical protein K0S32_2237 [Bacteroidetes bacterium]|jgi:hypothetical protein|nr:hypothetical protein [Bacteroidota bacterium]
MDRSLNKLVSLLLIIFSLPVLSQNSTGGSVPANVSHNPEDYKDPKQFDKFRKRKDVVAAWQVNELKQGALVVRLKTNKTLLDELNKQGKTVLALEKQKEQHAINMNTIAAYKDKFTFCKVYFIFSNSSDSLLNGARSGIFVDSTLKVDPSITMNEKFYLLAERDYGYNSSIGFVPEDSARKVIEVGNPVKEMAIVVKNKYGHQLKGPFPYFVKEKNFMDATYDVPINVEKDANGNVTLNYTPDKTYLADIKERNKGTRVPVRTTGNSKAKIKKQYTYEKIAEVVDQLNDNFHQFYQGNVKPDLTRIDQEIKQFLY